jgi:hypothetical protein
MHMYTAVQFIRETESSWILYTAEIGVFEHTVSGVSLPEKWDICYNKVL